MPRVTADGVLTVGGYLRDGWTGGQRPMHELIALSLKERLFISR